MTGLIVDSFAGGGGIDLKFPHHVNERAQCGCAMAREWMHVGHLTLGGQKMSKSLGHDVHVDCCPDPMALRLALLGAHWRQPLAFSEARLEQAQRLIDRWRRRVGSIEAADAPAPDVMAALRDGLNMPKALSLMPLDPAKLRASAAAMGIEL